MELSVHKEIICKRQNHRFLFNKCTYHHRHLTKNGRQLELVPVLLFSLVDALLGEHLSKTDISSVYRAGPIVVRLKSELAGQTMDGPVILKMKQAFSKSFWWKTIFGFVDAV